MAADAAQRFNFQFAELAPAPRVQILRAAASPLPEGAVRVLPRRRPRWMPRLLPVFSAAEPMLIEVLGGAAPAFGARLVTGLGQLIACAGAEAGVACITWPGGLTAGVGRLERLVASPHAVVIAVEMEPGSIALARTLVDRPRGPRVVLAINGRAPALERALGVDDLAGRAATAFRLPLPTEGDLRLAAGGVAVGTGRRRPANQWVAFAAGLVRAYLGVAE